MVHRRAASPSPRSLLNLQNIWAPPETHWTSHTLQTRWSLRSCCNSQSWTSPASSYQVIQGCSPCISWSPALCYQQDSWGYLQNTFVPLWSTWSNRRRMSWQKKQPRLEVSFALLPSSVLRGFRLQKWTFWFQHSHYVIVIMAEWHLGLCRGPVLTSWLCIMLQSQNQNLGAFSIRAKIPTLNSLVDFSMAKIHRGNLVIHSNHQIILSHTFYTLGGRKWGWEVQNECTGNTHKSATSPRIKKSQVVPK